MNFVMTLAPCFVTTYMAQFFSKLLERSDDKLNVVNLFVGFLVPNMS